MDQMMGIIWDATKCLCGCAYEQAAYICDLEENLKSLTKKWEDLHSMRQDVQGQVDEAENTGEKKRSQQVNTWLRQIKGIEEEIENIQVQGVQEIQNKCLSKCCSKNCASNYKLGKKVVKMLKDVDEMATTGKSFNKVEIAHKLPSRQLEMPLDDTVGLDVMLKKVWKSIEAVNVGVIGLYGMGGAGKTTLLKRINNKFRRLDFDVVMWVVVSKEPNLDKIMEDIKTQVSIVDESWRSCISRDAKVAKIYQVLKQKKFVLLLDDIWERFDLKMVGVPHPKETNFQSKVLFTTRSEDVCAKMQAQKKFKVECLSKKEAFELFRMKVGEETLNSHPDIPKLAEEIAAECKGLPLALNVVGSAMAGVKSVQAWEHSKNDLRSSPWIASDLEKDVFSILKFSYDRLPDETHRNCFLYCALFPEDHEIKVGGLIEKWIGEGFLDKDWTKSVYDMDDYGESVIEKLRLSSLLEDGGFRIDSVKMHDVIRDMALWLGREQDKNKNKILVQGEAFAAQDDDAEKWKSVERISIIDCDDDWHVPKAACPNLISLTSVTFLANKRRKIIGLSNIQYMSRLKVLDLSFDDFSTVLAEVPPEIGHLILLEYLSLRGEISVSKFLMELKNLKNLKNFSLVILDNGDLAIIPSEVISSLKQVKVLTFITNENRIEGEEKAFLENLESLQNLEKLCIQIKTGDGLEKLHQSTKLQSCVNHLHLEKIGILIDMQLLLESMSKLKHLQTILFNNLHFNIVEDSSIFFKCRLSKLCFLTIKNCHSIIHLTWIKHAPLLRRLEILDCKSMEEVIKEGTEDDEDRENADNTFLSLLHLSLLRLPKLKSICKTVLPFPSLRFIHIYRCPNLNKLPFNSNSAKDNLRGIDGS